MKRNLGILFVLVFLLVPAARVLAFDEATRTYSVDTRVQEMENKIRAAQEQIILLANKANQLEVRAIATDARLDVLAAKLNDLKPPAPTVTLQAPAVTVPAGTTGAAAVVPQGAAAETLQNEKLKKRTSQQEPLKSL